MGLRVTRPPNPAAGADWLTTVPGQQAWDIQAVAATLTTVNGQANTNSDTSADFSNGTFSSNGRLNVGAAGFNPGVGPWTIEGWFRGWDGQRGAGSIWTETTAVAPSSLNSARVIVGSDGRIEMFAGDTVGTDVTTASGLWVANTCWHHAAVTVTGPSGTVVIYLDGVAVKTDATTAYTLGASTQNCCGGFFIAGITSQFAGFLDEVAVYHSALSAARVLAHYDAMTAGFGPGTAAILADGPVTYYHLDETQGATTWVDATGNGHNGLRAGSILSQQPGATACGAGRTPTLIVTDGTNRVIAAPVPSAQAGGTAVRYVWGLNPRLDAGQAGVTTVVAGMADVVTPAGFTVGTSTQGLTVADRWSNIAVWWDDRYSPDRGGGRGQIPYLNALIHG